MAKAAVATQSEFQAIDRLEEKLKMLVSALDRTRGEYSRAVEENGRLRAELDATRARLNEAEGVGTELNVLRNEREQVRSRVEDMLKQIEALNI